MDFKMKFEEKHFRESTQLYFGKRGIGWHGCMLIFFIWQNEAPICHTIFIDQILSDKNKQDGLTILSLLEAAQLLILKSFPFLSHLILLSDNAVCYHVKEFIIGIGILNCCCGGVPISRYIHTETQDGKSALDGHFGLAQFHINYFMRMTEMNKFKKIATSVSLADALSWRNGMKNSAVQLVVFDRSKVALFKQQLQPTTTKLQEYFSQANDIIYLAPSSNLDKGGHVAHFHTLMVKSTVENLLALSRKNCPKCFRLVLRMTPKR